MALTAQKTPAATPAKDTSKTEKRVPHMKKALIAFSAILAVMCVGVLVKGALRKPPRVPGADATSSAAAPGSKASGATASKQETPMQADVDGFHEKLAGYRQRQAGTTVPNPVAGSTAGVTAEGGAPVRGRGAISEEERNFLVQKLRQPMQVHTVGDGQAVTVQQQPAGASGQSEADARFARLSAQLAEIKAKQGAQK